MNLALIGGSTSPAVTTRRELLAYWTAYRIHLQSENKADSTVTSYNEAITQLADFLLDPFAVEPGLSQLVASGKVELPREWPGELIELRRVHIEAFIGSLLRRHKATTAANRYRSLRAFFRWLEIELEDERDIVWRSPVRGMTEPSVPDEPVPVIEDDQVKAILAGCNGRTFDERRDHAILRLFAETGMRRAEMAGIELGDVDLAQMRIVVTGKGAKTRHVYFGPKVAKAIDRYLRARAAHKSAALPNLWLGRRGAFGISGIRDVIQNRAIAAGLGHLKPHQFRHTFSHVFMLEGGQEHELMRLMGWSSDAMPKRYGKSAADERAREAYRRIAPGNRY